MTALKRILKERGMMQAELAAAAEISRPFVCDLVKGIRGARPDTWQRIADVLGCTVEEVKGEKSETGS